MRVRSPASPQPSARTCRRRPHAYRTGANGRDRDRGSRRARRRPGRRPRHDRDPRAWVTTRRRATPRRARGALAIRPPTAGWPLRCPVAPRRRHPALVTAPPLDVLPGFDLAAVGAADRAPRRSLVPRLDLVGAIVPLVCSVVGRPRHRPPTSCALRLTETGGGVGSTLAGRSGVEVRVARPDELRAQLLWAYRSGGTRVGRRWLHRRSFDSTRRAYSTSTASRRLI